MKQWLSGLAGSGLNYIALTLYSLKEEIHNYLRGMPDSYKRLMQAIEYLDKYRNSLEITIDTVIMAPNLDGLLKLANHVRKDDRISSLFFQAVVQPFHSPLRMNGIIRKNINFFGLKRASRPIFLLMD